MVYLAWTAVEYATYVEETKNCTDCKCTPLNQQKRNERAWIFDGEYEKKIEKNGWNKEWL